MNPAELQGRARGCALGHMVGDALGAAVEGWPTEAIRELARERCGGPLLDKFILAVPMGTFVPANEPAQYRPAREILDTSFVPSGPPRSQAVAEQCARIGMYTDDTNAALAVGSSLAECRRVDAQHVATRSAEFFRDNEHYRGCPPTAKQVQHATLAGVPAAATGLPPHFPFPGGSFANGGAMKISLLAIAFRNAPPPILRSAVTQAVLSTHRHPEAVDFAVVQAAAVQHCLNLPSAAEFDSAAFLHTLQSRCETPSMQTAIDRVAVLVAASHRDRDSELAALTTAVETEQRPGSNMSFQIASVHMCPCVLWAVCRAAQTPELALPLAIDLGGDTDTTAAMVGAIVGALHGEAWCAPWAAELENGVHGRDYALGLAGELAALDLTTQ
mmetsp:Transcript_44271/g.90369  ORF Transcript_44271/g.90369 Transcript_44271/m.90369 type:complete len:387 (+) Transcript_44271:235-1395(+)|eukprot:CAMPEP_0181340156 /NCGR_PEP_ID=MMETSP1101-20121128/29679_1 /TAXON_ID=46948 /ORGANISM="Rhodomonas abbreviata, Strain Caron Lab Isolate" /LENGTH=386 /DNA_ID=CAMNT_0023451253 /DNA_START=341 /DNA_END=1501 /DNA_ORIENTATION=-